MTVDIDIRHAGSAWHFVDHFRRSRSLVQVQGHRREVLLKWSVRPRIKAFLVPNSIPQNFDFIAYFRILYAIVVTSCDIK